MKCSLLIFFLLLICSRAARSQKIDSMITVNLFEWNYPQMKYDSISSHVQITDYSQHYIKMLTYNGVTILAKEYTYIINYISNYDRSAENLRDTSYIVETFFLYKEADKMGLYIDENKHQLDWLPVDSTKLSLFAFQLAARQENHIDKIQTGTVVIIKGSNGYEEEYSYYSKKDPSLKGKIKLILTDETNSDLPFKVIERKGKTVLEASYFSEERIMQPNNVRIDSCTVYYKISSIKESFQKYRKLLSVYEAELKKDSEKSARL